ncbi:FMN-binding glutamate synthase family protein [uncultured Microbulbifer sp.]|uniref:FMN-binding glutamate synthase family protein n=1 Tax=uncultured Microbulbifer sp. TaxID=348147 RepID=UPI0026269E90|nr:FMN-binding glutamate synthase family protein [uncultured Microbulbifer sp.]
MMISNVWQAFSCRNGLKRAIIPLSALVLTPIFLILTVTVSGWWLIALGGSLTLLILGIYDVFQRQWTLTRNYPVAARIRWMFLNLRPYFRAYIVEGDEEGLPFSYEARRLVNARADGFSDMHPFGTELDVQAPETMWLTHSITPADTVDVRARIKVGTEQCSQPYNVSLLNVSAMSFGALSAAAVEALNKGAAIGGFYQDTGEGGISPYHRKHGGDLVWELGSGYFGTRNHDGSFNPDLFRDACDDQVKMTEIKLSQGAKPGHGGVLPGAKVTQEIASTRKVTPGEDCVSPRAHSMFSTPIELLQFADQMRSLSGGKPVGIKLCVGHIYEVMAIMKAMRETGILLDFIVVDGSEGGTGAAPLELSNHVGMPLLEGLVVVRNALVGAGLRDKVRLAASGKLYSASGLAACLAVGADWCNAARPFMFSIGCIQSQRCHTDTCPTGVTTQDPRRQRGLVVEVQSKRAAAFQAKTLEALGNIVAAAGLSNPRDLKPYHLYHNLSSGDSKPIHHIWHFIDEKSLIEAPEETPYGHWWLAAQADSFRPTVRLDMGLKQSIRRSPY